MRDRLLVAACCLAVLGPGQGFAQTYASVSGGLALLSDSDLEAAGGLDGEAEFEAGFTVNGALGYDWRKFAIGSLRTELEIGYRMNDVDELSASGVAQSSDADLSALSGMLNFALDVETGMTVQPYVLAGLGVANLTFESDDLDVDEDDTVFAYQLGAGINVPITTSSELFAGYRFFATAEPEFEGTEAEYHSHTLEAGLRTRF